MKKIGCVLSYDVEKYKDIAQAAYNSFVKWNPEVETHLITPNNITDYEFQYEKTHVHGINKFMMLREIMFQNDYDKIISLDTDTLTAARLDEFLDNDTDDILTTLNYWIHEETEYWSTPIIEVELPEGDKVIEHLNINAGICCFNSLEALESVIQLTIEHLTHFAEQGGLNEMAWVNKQYNVNIVDSPYPLSKVSYNTRSKGVPRCEMIEKGKIKNCWPQNLHALPQEWLMSRNLIDGHPSPIHSWYVRDKKLYTHDHKQIKCFHYVEGLGCQSLDKFYELINDFRTNWFNEDTKSFFRKECNCKEFFKHINK